MKRFSYLCLVALAVACGPDGFDGDPVLSDGKADRITGEDYTGECHLFVANDIQLPASQGEASRLALDLDADGNADNQLGKVLALIQDQGVDVAGLVSQGVASGDIILLSRLRTDDIASDESALFQLYQGDPILDPDYSGNGTFSIASTSPRDTLLGGSIARGKFSGGPGALSISLPILGSLNVEFALVGARALMQVRETGWTGGLMGGAITDDDMQTNILPMVAVVLNLVIASDPKAGESLLEYFDANDDGEISAQELRDNWLVKQLLKPDVDLFDADGNFDPGKDGVPESISFGMGLSSVSANFEVECGRPEFQ